MEENGIFTILTGAWSDIAGIRVSIIAPSRHLIVVRMFGEDVRSRNDRPENMAPSKIRWGNHDHHHHYQNTPHLPFPHH